MEPREQRLAAWLVKQTDCISKWDVRVFYRLWRVGAHEWLTGVRGEAARGVTGQAGRENARAPPVPRHAPPAPGALPTII
ncbi:unnamed protein product [Leptosia nina]|uniref:Uncharacterized protein n=1 Tax=Leptosia nina TaxID=320188 RepID=A0AAV1K6Q4_9NEOP